MTVREIVQYPDQRLRQPAKPVVVFDASLNALFGDLLDTMRAAPGIGIAGPHIGEPWRIVVLELTPGEVRVYVNPQTIRQSEERQTHEEGSISMPGATEMVERAARVRVHYRDLDGVEKTEDAEGLLAICLQHEIDQLNGIFWLQRLSRLKREMLVRKWEKKRKQFVGLAG